MGPAGRVPEGRGLRALHPTGGGGGGLKARGGAEAVGEATTDGVVAASLGCLLIDLAVSLAFQLLRL
ncbi:ABC transporter permease [Myxococcus sp. 1LA]